MSNQQQQQHTRNTYRRVKHRDTVNEKLRVLLERLKSDEESLDNVMKELTFKEKVPDVPYFRRTRSGAVSCHGIKREAIVLYRDQWLRLSKVFQGGKKCSFNRFFHGVGRTTTHNSRVSVEPVEPVEQVEHEEQVEPKQGEQVE